MRFDQKIVFLLWCLILCVLGSTSPCYAVARMRLTFTNTQTALMWSGRYATEQDLKVDWQANASAKFKDFGLIEVPSPRLSLSCSVPGTFLVPVVIGDLLGDRRFRALVLTEPALHATRISVPSDLLRVRRGSIESPSSVSCALQVAGGGTHAAHLFLHTPRGEKPDSLVFGGLCSLQTTGGTLHLALASVRIAYEQEAGWMYDRHALPLAEGSLGYVWYLGSGATVGMFSLEPRLFLRWVWDGRNGFGMSCAALLDAVAGPLHVSLAQTTRAPYAGDVVLAGVPSHTISPRRWISVSTTLKAKSWEISMQGEELLGDPPLFASEAQKRETRVKCELVIRLYGVSAQLEGSYERTWNSKGTLLTKMTGEFTVSKVIERVAFIGACSIDVGEDIRFDSSLKLSFALSDTVGCTVSINQAHERVQVAFACNIGVEAGSLSIASNHEGVGSVTFTTGR